MSREMDSLALQLLQWDADGGELGTVDPLAPWPDSVKTLLDYYTSGDFVSILTSPFARLLLGSDDDDGTRTVTGKESSHDFSIHIGARISSLLSSGDAASRLEATWLAVIIGFTALQAFLQSTVTGPPLPATTREAIFPRQGELEVESRRKKLIASLTVDGAAAHHLTPDVELFCLARLILEHEALHMPRTARLRLQVKFIHQRMLSEQAPTVQSEIYRLLETLEVQLSTGIAKRQRQGRAEFLLERATIHTYYGFDEKARADLDRAAKEIGFVYALTGRLGKRTKFQEKDTSQLVVLARSIAKDDSVLAKEDVDPKRNPETASSLEQQPMVASHGGEKEPTKPTVLDLNDDTLLDNISFTKDVSSNLPRPLQDDDLLPAELIDLDASDQPRLEPLESIILLSLASSITNTSPADGLTREETLPYATRVLDGGSNNWQIYTQALLVRSRIEGYKTRTFERSVLQLQALVDQVIAETTPQKESSDEHGYGNPGDQPSTFLPRPTDSDSAPVTERLRYIYQLSSPTRWELEAELAARWISLGGIKTALEIYERLQMWAEIALCWAGLDKEEKAREVLQTQLFDRGNMITSDPTEEEPDDVDEKNGASPVMSLKDALPADAPRLLCILGDIDHSPEYYETAWSVSGYRYARAQRSLGKHYFSLRDYVRAAEAYEKALRVNQLNHGSWYALGCARLQLGQWDDAMAAFIRAVQLEEEDAEGWSNLAAALLEKAKLAEAAVHEQQPSKRSVSEESLGDKDAELAEKTTTPPPNPPRLRLNALKALKRASSLQFDNWRIWENLLVVAATTTPPSYTDMISALDRILSIRGPSAGERAIDIDMLTLLVRHVTSTYDPRSSSIADQPFSERFSIPSSLITLVDNKIKPLITTSPPLWALLARLSLWRRHPRAALESYEKAWRAALAAKGWEDGIVGASISEAERMWDEVVERTEEVVGAYESLGGMEVEVELNGPAKAEDGEMNGRETKSETVIRGDWTFKARSAIRTVMGRGRVAWEGSEGWKRLGERLEEVKRD
ncbi:MAG: hypothetical protein M1817_003323 [Caeruleum heppii]|nr:MAG: hypothetical protein M1817_003323 [Caeruleum heppii]